MPIWLLLVATVSAYVQLDAEDLKSTEYEHEPEPTTSDVAGFVKAMPIADHIMTAFGKVQEQEPELFEMLYHPSWRNKTSRFREHFKHYVGEDIKAHSSSYTIVPQMDAGSGHKVGFIKIKRDVSTPDKKDKMCSDECDKTAGCEYWIRQTNGEGCWLMQKYRGAGGSFYRRLGISNNDGAKCSVAKVAVRKVNKWLAQNTLNDTINDPPQFDLMHVKLPTDFLCVAAAHEKTKTFVFNFKKIDIKVQTWFDAGGMEGHATAFLRLNLDAALSWDDWKVKHTKVNVVQAHVGLQTVSPGPISHWVSGSSYAALKSDDTCDTMVPAYAANWIHGKTWKKFEIVGKEQAAANRDCCNACKADPDCDGFQVARTDHTKKKLCEFRRPYKDGKNRHFNYAGKKKTIKANTDGYGDRVGYIDLPGGHTQDEIDAMCSKGCTENPDCQSWVTSTNNPAKPQCWMLRDYKLDDGLVQGIVRGQLSGQLNDAFKKGMKALMKHMKEKCEKETPGKC